MAIKVNAATEVTGGALKLYTGVAPLKVLLVNPNQDQFKELGYKMEKAPVYRDDKNGTRIVLLVEGTDPSGEKFKFPMPAFFVKNERQQDVFINKTGNYGKDRTKVNGEVRNPYKGEIDLLEFVRAWCNIKKDEELYLDSIDKIAATGDVYELREILKNGGSNNFFKALLTVETTDKGKKYQRVFTGKFERAFSNDYSYIHKALVRQKDYIKEDIGGIDFALYVPSQFELKPYTSKSTVAAAAPGTASSKQPESTAGAAQSAGVASNAQNEDDDAPF